MSFVLFDRYGSDANALLRLVCAVATAAENVSSVCWKSVLSATTELMKFFRLSYAVCSAVSADSPALLMKVMASFSVVNTGAVLSSVSENIWFSVPK